MTHRLTFTLLVTLMALLIVTAVLHALAHDRQLIASLAAAFFYGFIAWMNRG